MPPADGTTTWLKRENRRLTARVAELEARVAELQGRLEAREREVNRLETLVRSMTEAWKLGRDVLGILEGREDR